MYSIHNHDGKSNASRGFADSSIKLRDLVIKAKELGLEGIAITNHETVGSFIEAKNLEKELDFPIICGNEIYLVSDKQYDNLKNNYNSEMYYPHFILLALDEIGNQQLRELSTIAWTDNSFTQRRLIRTPTKMSDIVKVIGKDKGHIVASSACLGGQVDKWILDIVNPEKTDKDKQEKKKFLNCFIQWCLKTFGEDKFFLECQPASETQEEQIIVNNYILQLSKEINVPYIITTDSHYLSKDLLPLHSSFLNSSEDSDREVEAFYKTAYLMSESEVIEYFKPYWNIEDIQKGLDNTTYIGKMAQRYEMKKKQIIPKIKLDEGWKIDKNFFPHTEFIQKMINSEYEQDRYLMYKIQQGIKKLIVKEDYQDTFNRIEQEVTEFWYISDALNDRLGSYFVTISKLVEIMWNEGDSLVCPGRGSGVSSIIDYLLEVTQINPLKMPVEMPFYRFVDRARVELADIDIDTQSDKRQQVFNAVKNYFESLGGEVVNCCTYGTIGSRSAIITSCRGLGISPEEAQVISSLIPVERGFNWTLSDCYNGNEKTGRKPIPEFVNLINEYEGLWELATLIEGVVISRGTHASGVFITNDKFENYNAKMRSSDGTLVSQWDLHESEQYGLIKYDFLTTSALTKIRLTMEMLIENNHIERKNTLKETYLNVLDVHKIDYDKSEIWELIKNNGVPDLFQFDSQVAMQTIKQIQPKSLVELAQTNSLMRLQAQEGKEETPTETYVRYKKDINEWYKDMDKYGVPKKDQKIIEEVILKFNGVCDTQEAIMALSRLEKLTNFTIGEAHELRSVIAKKKMNKIPLLKEKFYKMGLNNGVSKNTLDYVWNEQILLQLGYAFSILHCIAYTFVALQELILFYKYPSIYWNCACLTVNSGSVEDETINENNEEELPIAIENNQLNEDVIESEEENNNDDNKNDNQVKKKQKSTKYGKIATAIGHMQKQGVNISLPDINRAKFSFTPDETNNEIIFGLKGITGIGDEIAYEIIKNRPYNNFNHFLEKTSGVLSNTQIIKLIKAGSFNNIEKNKNREELLRDFIKVITPTKDDNLTFQNMPMLINYNCLEEKYAIYQRYYKFRQYIFNKKFFYKQDEKAKTKKHYILDDNFSVPFFLEHFDKYLEENKDWYYNENGKIIIIDKNFNDKAYTKAMQSFKEALNNDTTIRNKLNSHLLKENFDKYGKGTIAKWEMESVSFYYINHELDKMNKENYSIDNFFELPENPVLIREEVKGKKRWKIFQLNRIAGTVLDKDKNKHMITLLTTDGVVTVKFYAGAFNHYNAQLSIPSTKKGKEKEVIEKSWFKKGDHLLITGIRTGDVFRPKTYFASVYKHTVSKILSVKENGDLELQLERKRVEDYC